MELIKKYSNRPPLRHDAEPLHLPRGAGGDGTLGQGGAGVDAKERRDLTQLTLAQIIFESKNAARLLRRCS